MRSMYHGPIVREAEEAAEPIPPNQGKIPPVPASRKEKLIEAASVLGTLFDQGMSRINMARARAGPSAVIWRRQEQGARCYYALAPEGGERTLMLCIALPLVDGDIFGGAYIRPSCAQEAMYVIPSIAAESPRWLVQASGTELTIAVVDDLFRATFDNDRDAAKRLAPLYGFDLFATPWS